MNKTKSYLFLVLPLVLLSFGAFSCDSKEEITPVEDTAQTTETNDAIKPADDEGLSEVIYSYRGSLADVTTGPVRQTDFPGDATGYAQSDFLGGKYQLYVTFENLPEPQGGDFYEGWVVQKSPFKFISTGKLEMEEGQYVNRFESDTDYTSYSQYVLTIEPDDGDPAPAEHVVEGDMVK